MELPVKLAVSFIAAFAAFAALFLIIDVLILNALGLSFIFRG